MSDLPESLRDQYGSPQDANSQSPFQSQHPQQQRYYPEQAQQNFPPSVPQPMMNQPQGGTRHSAMNMGALAGALPDTNYAQGFPQQQNPQRYQTLPPGAALAYQMQQPFPQPVGHQARAQQPSPPYTQQFAQPFQGMYGQGAGANQGGQPMNQQPYSNQGFPQQQVPPFFYQQPPQFAGQSQMFQGNVFPLQRGHIVDSNQSSRRPSEQLSVAGSDIGRNSSAGSSAGNPTTIRGPPRKPKQTGHALWVGNLPPGASVVDLKDHFSRDATHDILSVFLISKSSCAFVNYKSEEACAAAMARFHDSRLNGVRLVCRLRRSAASVPVGVPRGPAAAGGGKAVAKEMAATEDEDADVKNEDGEDKVVATDKSSGAPAEGVPAKDKYFIVKSLTVEDLEMSVRNGIWATQSHNEAALDKAYKTAETVYLIFSANKSGEYYGYARMTSPINHDPAAAIAFAPAHVPATPAPASATASATGIVGGRVTAPIDPDQPTATPTPATATAPRGRIIDDSARGTIFWEADLETSPADSSGPTTSTDNDSSTSTSSSTTGQQTSTSTSTPLPTDSDPNSDLGSGSGSGSGAAAYGKPFSVHWESTRRVPFFRTRGLKNAWNAGREVKIARDGTEIETGVGRRLIGLFGEGGGR